MQLRLRLSLAGATVVALAGSMVPLLAARPDAISLTTKAEARADKPGRSTYNETCSRCHGPEGQGGKAPWLVPFGNQDWMVFAAMGVLLVPFFFASWAVEYQVAKRRLTNELCELRDSTGPGESFGRDTFTREIRSAVRNANLISYALLGLFVLTLYLVTSGSEK